MTGQELASALLDVSEMPTGYSKDKTTADDGNDKTLCNYRQPVVAKITKSQDWTKGGLGPIATTILRQYSSTADARTAFSALQHGIGCGSFGSDGDKLNIAEVSFPKLGQGTVAVRLSRPSGNGELLEVYVLDGPTLVQVGQGGLSSDAEQAEQILRSQVHKYEQAAGH